MHTWHARTLDARLFHLLIEIPIPLLLINQILYFRTCWAELNISPASPTMMKLPAKSRVEWKLSLFLVSLSLNTNSFVPKKTFQTIDSELFFSISALFYILISVHKERKSFQLRLYPSFTNLYLKNPSTWWGWVQESLLPVRVCISPTFFHCVNVALLGFLDRIIHIHRRMWISTLHEASAAAMNEYVINVSS